MKSKPANAPSASRQPSAVEAVPSPLFGDDALLTPIQTAKELTLNVRTLERYRSLGQGPRWTRVGAKRVAYRIADVRQFILAGQAA